MSDIPCQTAVDTKALEASQDRVATCSPPSPAGTGCGSEAISSSRPHRPKLEDLENLTNPTGAFLREVCEIGPGRQVECSLLFCYWRAWAEKQNRQHVGTVQAFGVNIRVSIPGIRIRHGIPKVGWLDPKIEGQQRDRAINDIGAEHLKGSYAIRERVER